MLLVYIFIPIYLKLPNNSIEGSSAVVDSAANEVENVGGAIKTRELSTADKLRYLQLSTSTQKPDDNLFSHSIGGALNSLHYASLSRKNRTSSSNSMSSLDAASSTKALLRLELI